ncbi:hypothetical protein L218DRAFT_863521 [Marasmius fiardii PR-910]|nr:hypothetical protein L218DRAFT_863521 [Marasmius fiardii PR-910]
MFLGVKQQWQNPSDVFTVLMIVGGDIVQVALAQLASSRIITPVAFSFGWVSYSISAITSVIGSRRLAPQPDYSCLLIEASSGYPRDVNSWVLARFVRDHEHPKETVKCGRGLTITFYDSVGNGQAPDKKNTGEPDLNPFNNGRYWLALFVIFVQLGVAIIPGLLHKNWVILVITCGGTILAQVQGALPQWRKELWNARKIESDKKKGRVFCLTKGNGSMNVIVVRCPDGDLNLADIAVAREIYSVTTIVATSILAALWLALLFTTQGVKGDSWYLVGIGAIGMMQNAIVAGARCDPAAAGFHLRKPELSTQGEPWNVIHSNKVFKALQLAERVEKKVGIALLNEFFPGSLRPDEERWKEETLESYKTAA